MTSSGEGVVKSLVTKQADVEQMPSCGDDGQDRPMLRILRCLAMVKRKMRMKCVAPDCALQRLKLDLQDTFGDRHHKVRHQLMQLCLCWKTSLSQMTLW